MSKSYKKTPIIKDNGNSKKYMKRVANKHIRGKLKNDIEIGQGKQYKKHFDSWAIADYVSRWSKEDAIKEYNGVIKGAPSRNKDFLLKHYPTLESFLEFWEKCMKRK